MVKIIRNSRSVFSKILFLVLFFVVTSFFSKYFFFKPLPAKGSWLATTTWIGTASTGNWHDPTKWDNGVPTSTMLAIIASSSAITITATTTIEFDTLRIGGGGGTASSTLILATNIGAGVDIDIKTMGKITQSSTAQQTISGTLLIEDGGRLTHSGNTTVQARSVNFRANTITVNSGGVIFASSLGYAGSAGGSGEPGQGPGAGQSSGVMAEGGGGGHGGSGADDGTSSGGQGYCDITNLNTIGSGGGGNSSWVGTAGGGLIILSATGTITINGSILADGGTGGSFSAGGGAGGGIKITADVIAGTPSKFSADGGDTSGVGGGGGCVFLGYTTSNTIIPTSSYFSVNGGDGDGASASLNGSGGMVLVKQDSANGNLYVLNDVLVPSVTQPSSTVPAITADFIYVSSTVFQITSTKTFTLVNSDPFSGNGRGEIRIYGSMVKSAGVFDNVNDVVLTIQSGGSVAVSSTFTASSSLSLYRGFVGITTNTFTNLVIQSGTTTVHNYSTSSVPLTVSNLTVNGGIFTHGVNSSTQDNILNVAATSNITVNAGGTISASGTGYIGGVVGNGLGQGPGGASSSQSNTGAGGAHGGNGGNNSASMAGQGYCDISDVTTIGSGGAGSVSARGGAGGGLIILSATGTITLDGVISANGGAANDSSSGGGGGGGIKITADIIAGTPSKFFAAGGSRSSGNIGGGGGGCVNIFYTTSNTISPTSSYFSISGGVGRGTGVDGSGGMALIKQVGVGNGGLYVLNGAMAASAITQPSSTVPAITADFIYVSSTVFQITSTKTFTLVNNDPFSGNGRGEIRVYGSMVKSSGAFEEINDIIFTIRSGGSISVSSTFTASSSLNLYRGFIGTASNTFTNFIIQSGTTTLYDYNTNTVPLFVTNLTMNSSSVFTNATNTTAQSHILYVAASSSITINVGARAVSNGLGYAGGAVNTVGSGPGFGSATSSKGGGGGAHGGNGGDGASSGGLGGTAYCNSTNPTTIGSGGGGGNGQAGGYGGGLIIFSASSTITISGRIQANGNSTTASGGGGGGGAIRLDAPTVAGTPQSFTANGGNGGSTGGGGGGGGGCIFIRYSVSNSVTSSRATSTFGTGGTGIDGVAGTFETLQVVVVPTVTAIFPVQTSTNIVVVTTTIADSELNITSLAVLYSTDGTTWVSSTIVSVSQGGVGDGVTTSTGLISGIDTDGSGSINLTFEWNAGVDISSTEDTTVYIKITPNNGTSNGTAVSSTAFAADTKAPTAPGSLTLFNTSTQSATFTFGSTSTDSNFVQYIIFYKTGSSSVAITDTAFASSSNSNLGFINYNSATSTTVSGLATSTQYVFNIWAFDGFSNTPAATESSFYTLATVPLAPTLSNPATSTIDVTIASGDTNPAGVTYAIQEASSSSYVQSNGSLSGAAVWQSISTWGTETVTGLNPNTGYYFRVKARNGNNVETGTSTQSAIKYTLASVPSSVVAAADSQTQITLSWTRDATSSYAENVTASTTSSWISDTSYAFTGLTCATTYLFRVKAINGEGVETSFSSSVSAQTSACSSDESSGSNSGGVAYPVTLSPPPVVVLPTLPVVEPEIIEPESEIVYPATPTIKNVPPIKNIPPKVQPPKLNPSVSTPPQATATKIIPKQTSTKEDVKPPTVSIPLEKKDTLISTTDKGVIKNTSTKKMVDDRKGDFVSRINLVADSLYLAILRFFSWLKWW
ncbi:MAG: hypothetical protein A2563_05240 [Candidatus Magasanikbacteria bacterium RIFOXYD1_FULL_40_23]|uniref:Fibronectin type-III domain-containing protein n=1 Tax=Candidatus Magasanikbacteria bacterium RIFOXYD1_FULL_40_23 TaxID=1798705 RepID=A0A1F6P8B9_9BACT|nr:MAG: hypothetical protein A2563_05240 [Candidatus Magasanikbacteria bacterium RIFOXYD1_FULL_40_23]